MKLGRVDRRVVDGVLPACRAVVELTQRASDLLVEVIVGLVVHVGLAREVFLVVGVVLAVAGVGRPFHVVNHAVVALRAVVPVRHLRGSAAP